MQSTTPMKKHILLCTLSFVLLLSGCELFSAYGEVEYNNLIVDRVNETSLAIEETATLYNETLPSEVTEQDEVDITEMNASYETALELLANMNELLELESRNTEQHSAVRTELQTYMSAGDLYLESYSEMLTYYSSGTYKENITEVENIDEDLHVNYTTFIEANNDLVDILDSFMTEEE